MPVGRIVSIKISSLFLILACIIFSSCNTPLGFDRNEEPVSLSLDFQDMMKPVPLAAKLINDDYYIWGSSMIQGEDGLYHLFYSRWPRETGFNGWATHSEIAHATAKDPLGPFKFEDIALPKRGKEYWDGLVTHNPTVRRYDGKFYLYYMGNTAEQVDTLSQFWEHRNKQRIGVAITNKLNNDWKRFNKPLIDVSSDSNALDALMVSNPAIVQRPDGNFLMVYKAVGKKQQLPFGGPVVHMIATSENPAGPFKKESSPIFTVETSDFPAEDPFIWYQGNSYWAILKDMHGAFTEAGKALILFRSENGFDWELAENPLVTELEINWNDGTVQHVHRLERPQIWFNKRGMPAALFLATSVTADNAHSFNVHVPLEH